MADPQWCQVADPRIHGCCSSCFAVVLLALLAPWPRGDHGLRHRGPATVGARQRATQGTRGPRRRLAPSLMRKRPGGPAPHCPPRIPARGSGPGPLPMLRAPATPQRLRVTRCSRLDGPSARAAPPATARSGPHAGSGRLRSGRSRLPRRISPDRRRRRRPPGARRRAGRRRRPCRRGRRTQTCCGGGAPGP